MTAESRRRDTLQSDEKGAGSPLASNRVATTLGAAAAAGLTRGTKAKRISGRAHESLFRAAAERSGLDGSDLLEYALAKVALEDDFADKLLALEGRVSRDIDLEL